MTTTGGMDAVLYVCATRSGQLRGVAEERAMEEGRSFAEKHGFHIAMQICPQDHLRQLRVAGPQLHHPGARQERSFLRAALRHAVREDELPRNVARSVELSMGTKREIEPLTVKEGRQLLATARGQPSVGRVRNGGPHRPAAW
ncbi:hypothetical protein [Streptomyces benahoarensis]|uniref:hypothetical protein n=1 Tax=Streptomyces benahoarensis TaxID=2595054 RepID=UPI0020366280|nr:hypothetical protein [Streptomyces benahoarensis]